MSAPAEIPVNVLSGSRGPRAVRSTVVLRVWCVLIDMRKQARRLWLGDWHRDDEPAPPQPSAADPDQGDSVVFMPSDDGDTRPAEHRRNVRRGVAAVAAIALVCAVWFAVTAGDDAKPVASASSQFPPAQAPQSQVPPVPQGPPQGFGGADLTGRAATKAAEAAVAKYPGNVERVTRGPTGGGYVVHVIQPDGNEVHVAVDDQFKVQGSDAGTGAPGFGSGRSQ
jgi:hypothetical protein